MPAKKLYFAKNNPSPYVDLSLKFKGQTIPAYPIGQAEIYSKGQLRQTIQFSQEAGLPFVVNYDKSKNKISEGNATITGQVQQNWTVSKRGEWKYFENGQISSTSIYDPKGNISSEKLYNNGTITVENKFLPNGATEISSFYPNGKIKEKGLQKGKSKIGTWTYFTAEGKLATKIEYKNGREVFKVVQDDLGNIAKEIELVTDKSELPKSLNTLEEVYETRTYYSNSTVKTRGFESAAKKSGHI
jgi:antitoxin component YwqK of YwqJK toxin-antitoxin module